MNKARTIISFAVLVIGLLGSCSKINERLDGLDKRINNLEIDKIASVEQQIAAINQSIADLETIRTNIQTLMDAKEAQGEDITALKAAKTTLEGKVADLETYVNTKLAKYATTEWVNATFATLEKQAEIITDITKLKQDLAGLDAELDQAIADLDSSLKAWVNEQLSAYSTTAQMEAKVKALQDQIDALKTDNETNKSDIEDLEADLAQLEQDLESAKATIKTEYEKAIDDALKSNNGYITEKIKRAISSANGSISDLYGRVETLKSQLEALRGDVDALKEMIQSVTIVPAYNDGSVEADKDGIVYIDCIISPASAVSSLTKDNFTILVNEVPMTGDVTSIPITEDAWFTKEPSEGTISLKVPMSILTSAGSAITVAVKVNYKHSNNLTSDITTDFVPVTAVQPVLPTFKAVYNTNGGANTLTFFYDAVDHSGEGITVYEDGTDKSLFDGTKTGGAKWGYYSIRNNVKSVVIDASVASYSGLNSTTYMFYSMKFADNISGAEYLDVTNVTDMSYMFYYYGYSSTVLNAVPDVSDWNTDNVIDMSYMFYEYGYTSTVLNVVPDVSKWNTGKVTNMKEMFKQYGKESKVLNVVPDVSKWNTGKVTNMQKMFNRYGYQSEDLKAVPDVSKWNTGNVIDMSYMFYEYGYTSTVLNAVPDVSGWNTGKVTDMKEMFNHYGYKSKVLNVVPDVSKWNTGKVVDMSYMFHYYGRESEVLDKVPDVSKWNIVAVEKMASLFSGYGHRDSKNIICELDLSGWDLINVTNGYNAFDFNPKTFNVKIPAKTGDKANEADNWYYGNGTKSIAPPTGKAFTLPVAGALPGVFSVSATKKVQFSKGNLWADGSKALHFEANQYSSASSWDASHVSHFTWSSTVADAVGESHSGDYLFCDESHKVSVDGGEATYYALSKDEWQYLLKTRSNASSLYKCGVTVCGKANCVVLLPDGWQWNVNTVGTDWQTGGYPETATVNNPVTWQKMEAAGAVCLPAAGGRYDSEVYSVDVYGYYYTSTAVYNDSMSSYVYVGSSNVSHDTGYRYTGYSVRLVTDASAAPAPTPTTTGTAKRTGNVDVNWVQLWENGPKFAEYNVGASSATDVGSIMTFTDATNAGPYYVWGANWCTPSKEQMDELLKAATSDGSEKVNCSYIQKGGTWGFEFTGIETGYTNNSVFFPAQDGSSDTGGAGYWSSTGSGTNAWNMYLQYGYGGLYSFWDEDPLDSGFLVRLVLKN